MCSYCGCQSITVVGRFMAEHDEIINATGQLVRVASQGDAQRVTEQAEVVSRLLHPHTHAEEVGLFTVMREQEEFTDHIDVLCGEHTTLDALLDVVAGGAFDRAPEFEQALRNHIDKEDNGLFPAAAMSLDGTEWERVDATTPEAEEALTDGRGRLLPGKALAAVGLAQDHGHAHAQAQAQDHPHHHDHDHPHHHDHDHPHPHEHPPA